jgi:hypothetical protein
VSRIAPNPRRLTVRSPSCHVPADAALIVVEVMVFIVAGSDRKDILQNVFAIG